MTDSTSQGLVSALTGIVNAWSSIIAVDNTPTTTTRPQQRQRRLLPPPQTVLELKDRIQNDYDVNNYLWTGQLDVDCFDPQCRFTDPTLSFEGMDTYITNTQNLVPWVERLVENSQSILLYCTTTPDYIQTRWNMVGELNGLFWKPKIDVIGQTKFWFRRMSVDDSSSNANGGEEEEQPSFLQVYNYDEQWEIPAYQALLQLITPAGTFPNSTRPNPTTTTM